MSWAEALALGVVQGLTEFLPVSSSGHLVLFQALFGMKEPMLTFDVALHAGTLLAVLVYFRKEEGEILLGFWRSISDPNQSRGLIPGINPRLSPGYEKLWFSIFLTLIPTGLIAVLFKGYFESAFSDLASTGWQFIIMGALLLFGVKIRPGTRNLGAIGWWRALVIGIAQGAALVPAISRSGSTILTGMALGIKREDAAKFSFLISVPAILAAVVLELKDGGAYFAENLPEVLIGFTAAAVSGYAVIRWLMSVIQRGRFHVFGYYCVAAGALSLVLARFIR